MADDVIVIHPQSLSIDSEFMVYHKGSGGIATTVQAQHQRDTYAKRLILNFIHACENRRLQLRPRGVGDQGHRTRMQQQMEQDEDEKRKPHNIKQAQSSTNHYMRPSEAQYNAKSTLQNVHDAERQAAQYANENKIDLNFAIWVGMTGRNRKDYQQDRYSGY